jgi:hypothetical protein
VPGDKVSYFTPGEGVLKRVLERPQRLRQRLSLRPSPEEPGAVGCADDRHRLAGRLADPTGPREPVQEVAFRLVARGARHFTVGAQARIEKELVAEVRGLRVISKGIARSGGKGGKLLRESDARVDTSCADQL